MSMRTVNFFRPCGEMRRNSSQIGVKIAITVVLFPSHSPLLFLSFSVVVDHGISSSILRELHSRLRFLCHVSLNNDGQLHFEKVRNFHFLTQSFFFIIRENWIYFTWHFNYSCTIKIQWVVCNIFFCKIEIFFHCKNFGQLGKKLNIFCYFLIANLFLNKKIEYLFLFFECKLFFNYKSKLNLHFLLFCH